MDIIWNGINGPGALDEGEAQHRHELADAAKTHDWPRMMALLNAHPDFVNTTRPSGDTLYAPLHQVAHGGAPAGIVAELGRLGAWRTLPDAKGQRPVDIARHRGHKHLFEALEPLLRRDVLLDVLGRIQLYFHATIRGRAEREIAEFGLRLPELEPCWSSLLRTYGLPFRVWLVASLLNSMRTVWTHC